MLLRYYHVEVLHFILLLPKDNFAAVENAVLELVVVNGITDSFTVG